MKRVGSIVTLCLIAFASTAAAPDYPARPIRLIVPYPPGGNVDITARLIGPPLGEVLGQGIVVDNRSGAGGSFGANLVARAAPDGYTLLMGSSAPLSINTIVFKDIPYDGAKDFAPVSTVHVVTLVMLASQKSPVSSVQDLIARIKANPGKVTMASPGAGTTNHLAIELFASMTGTRPLHVPYGTSLRSDWSQEQRETQVSLRNLPSFGHLPMASCSEQTGLGILNICSYDNRDETH